MLIKNSTMMPGFVICMIPSEEYDFWEHYGKFQYKRCKELGESTPNPELYKYFTIVQSFYRLVGEINDNRGKESFLFVIPEFVAPELLGALGLYSDYVQSEIIKMDIAEENIQILKNNIVCADNFQSMNLYIDAHSLLQR